MQERIGRISHCSEQVSARSGRKALHRRILCSNRRGKQSDRCVDRHLLDLVALSAFCKQRQAREGMIRDFL